ncbi:hypothetical protein MRB53_018955 [Persea americana]|uniref:Uncharacterized protein n=1 Tax=Persea americana TaxID=3435 RepID=A0ACC2MA87_PERAE|nr:hypothetical protein MRB53_018955 [Persea americana]
MASPAKITNQKKAKSIFSEEELQVAEILFQLQQTSHHSRSLPFLFWGTKKKRSSIIYSISAFFNGEKSDAAKVDAPSPATPLSFSPSESESKPKQLRRARRRAFKRKKSNEQLREVVAELTSQREQLKHEITKVLDYYEKLQAANLALKARRSELFLLRRRGQFDLNSCKSLNAYNERTEQLNPVFEGKQAPIIHPPSELSAEERKASIVQHTPSVDATTIVGNFRYPQVDIPFLSESGLTLQSNCSYPVLGKNLFAEEAARRDFHCKAAMAAQARKRRIGINRVKNSTASKQQRLR